MKIGTAIRNAMEVARRVRDVNGILATPDCGHDAVRIRRMWVFGSTVKGSLSPNDLDLLIDMQACGRHHIYSRGRKFDKEYRRAFGMKFPPCSRKYALMWLTRGMKMVSRHCLDIETAEIDVKVMLYPRNDFAALMAGSLINQAAQTGLRRAGSRTAASSECRTTP